MKKRLLYALFFIGISVSAYAIAPFFDPKETNAPPRLPRETAGMPRRMTGAPKVAGTQYYPSAVGDYNIIVVLMQFPNKGFDISSAQSEYRNLFFGTNRPLASVRDYYYEVSGGKLRLGGEVFGPYTSASNYEFYGAEGEMDRSAILASEAMERYAVSMNGTSGVAQYDNNNDKYIDAVVIVHAGPGNELVPHSSYIHSHRWFVNSGYNEYYSPKLPVTVITDSASIKYTNDQYMVVPEVGDMGTSGYASTKTMTIGTWAHELGHTLGLPDLYSTEKNPRTYGAGTFDLMASGSYNAYNPQLGVGSSPAHIDGYWKMSLGWIEPRQLNVRNVGETIVISNFAKTGDVVFVVPLAYSDTSANAQEFFMIENRQLHGFDKGLPGAGLLIWHIDRAVIAANYDNNTIQNNPSRKGLDIEEASGTQHLDNYGNGNHGDSNDFWVSNEKSFTRSSTPSTILNNGSYPDIEIVAISDLSDVMTFKLKQAGGLSVVAMPNIYSYAKGGEIVFQIVSTTGEIAGLTEMQLHLYSMSGKKVATVKGFDAEYKAHWNVRDAKGNKLPEGMYYCGLDSNKETGYTTRIFITHRGSL